MQPDTPARQVRRPAPPFPPDSADAGEGSLSATIGHITVEELAARVDALVAALRLSETRLERVLQATGALAYELDAATGQVDVVGDTQRMLGYAPENTTAWWHQSIHPEDLARATGEL